MSKENKKTGWFTWLLTIAFIVLAVSFCATDKSANQAQPKRKINTAAEKEDLMCKDSGYAWVMAGNFVKKRLASPSSAKFPHNPDSYSYLGDCRHSITGTVTAHNAFGVMIQNSFTITLVYLKVERKWRSESLDIY